MKLVCAECGRSYDPETRTWSVYPDNTDQIRKEGNVSHGICNECLRSEGDRPQGLRCKDDDGPQST